MFKVESVKLVPENIRTGRRRVSHKTRIYFWPKGETIMDNLFNRRSRPFNEYRKLLPAVFAAAGVEDTSRLSARWSQRAGCGCGCSPGFIVEGYSNALYRNNIHVDVVAE
jgi:hypothetical protein